MIDLKEFYWLTGVFEGEGYFGLRRGKDLVIQLTMTDVDIVDRIESILGFGSRAERSLPSGKIAFTWTSTNQRETAGLMMTMLPMMGSRRAEKIQHCLAEWKTKPLPKKMWTLCKNGHALSGDNLRTVTEGKYKKRRCLECAKLRQRKHRASLEQEGIAA